MSWRHKINGPMGIAAIAVIFLICVVILVLYATREGPRTRATLGFYFLDLQTKRLFGAPQRSGPIDAPSGPDNGVRAFVYACGDCADKSRHVTAYLEKYTPEALAAADNPNLSLDDRDHARFEGQLVRKVDGGEWVKARSDEGNAVTKLQIDCPVGQMLRPCTPTADEMFTR